jgi:hypothetical protein
MESTTAGALIPEIPDALPIVPQEQDVISAIDAHALLPTLAGRTHNLSQR